MQLFQQYPSPNSDATGDLFDLRGYTFAGANPQKLNTYIAKLDFRIDPAGRHTVLSAAICRMTISPTRPCFPASLPRIFSRTIPRALASATPRS